MLRTRVARASLTLVPGCSNRPLGGLPPDDLNIMTVFDDVAPGCCSMCSCWGLEMIKEARLQWLGSSLDSTAVVGYLRSMAAVLLSGCCGDVAGLLESRLDDGAVADEARWREQS